MKVTNLQCEYTSNPLGIDTRLPGFSWILNHHERGQSQSAYHILVATSQALLDAEQGDMWDSGKIESEQSANVTYAGKALESRTLYYWKIRAWDACDHASPYSSAATFEMGLLRPEEWQAEWISNEGSAGPVFRKEFRLEQSVRRARLYISGLGYYEARLNGTKVGDHVLDPGWTDYDNTILYATFDVTRLLQPGANACGIMLGNGRFAYEKTTLQKNPNSLKTYGQWPLALAQLSIEFTDGTTLRIGSDTSWKTAGGPIVFNDLYDGERYDARLEQTGWDMPGYDDSAWAMPQKAPIPSGSFFSQATFPPIKINHTLLPQTISTPKPGVFVYDFGQNFTGWVKLRVSGPRGAEVKIRHAELLHRDGTLNVAPNRAAAAEDAYILKGEGEEIFEPRFTYHGFQFVEITGFPGTPSLKSIEGRVVHSAVPSRGSFLCSNDVINQIHQNTLWGQLSNLMSIPTDCPQRDERMGWMGDAQLTVEEAVYNFDMAGFYTKWLRDIKDAQKENGSVPDVVPVYWNIYPADPAWGTACMIIPWTVYLYYNDQRILEHYYPMMTRYVEFLDSIATDGMLVFGKYGDWCPPWHVHSVDTSPSLVSQWYYYHDTLLLSKIANVLGKAEDVDAYSAKAEKLKAIFNEMYLGDDRYAEKPDPWFLKLIPEDASQDIQAEMKKHLAHTFEVRSQTGQALALFLGLVPEDKQDAVLQHLIDDIIVVHGKHLNTGIVGTRYILDVLVEQGYAELAYQLVTETTYPSWGYMLKEGATTLWERWEYLTDVGMNSQNHIMLGSVDAWFYRFLGGIQIDPSVPGWQKIIIKPHILGDLQFVSASLHTVRGLVSSRWTKGYDSVELQVSVPVNSQAVVSVPTAGLEQVRIRESGSVIWEHGKPGQAVAGITGGHADTGYVTFTVGSGAYVFDVRGTPPTS